MAQPPVPKPRFKPQSDFKPQSVEKRELVKAFEGFSSNAVNQQQLQLAKACIEAGVSDCYQLLPFERILELNRVWKYPSLLYQYLKES